MELGPSVRLSSFVVVTFYFSWSPRRIYACVVTVDSLLSPSVKDERKGNGVLIRRHHEQNFSVAVADFHVFNPQGTMEV